MMLFPARLRLIVAVSVFAYASTLCHAQQTNDEVVKYLRSLPPGTPVEIQTSTTEQKADGQGASGQSTGDKANQTIDSTAPHVAVPGVIANGGDTHAKQEAQVSGELWYRILLLVAGLGCLGGAAWKALKTVPPELDTAIGLAVAGGVLILCALFPFLLYLLVIAVVLAGVSHFLPDKAKSALVARLSAVTGAAATSTREADATLSAFDELCEAVANDPAATSAVRAHLDRHADDPDFPLLTARLRKAGMKFSS